MLRTPSPDRPGSIEDLISPALAAQLARVDLASRRVFAGRLRGERRSKKRGESVEFADHRPYTVGDDLRFIDWNIYARLDRLFLKMFLEEEDLSLHLVLDASASMDCGEPGKFAFMQRLAAALGYIGLVNYNRVTLTAIGGQTGETPVPLQRSKTGETLGTSFNGRSGATDAPAVSLRNLRGRRRVSEMGSWLCGLDPGASADFTSACKRIALSRTGKGVMVVLSDFFFKEGYEDGLRLLVGRGYDVFAVQILSPQEIDPTLGGDLRLKDVEDADSAEVTISRPLLDRYKNNLAAYCDGLRLFCARRDVMHLVTPSSAPVDTLVLDTLRRRGLLR